MTNIAPLTKRQREIYDFLCKHIQAQGFAPSLEEICAAFGLSALATVHKHLTCLEKRGYIRRQWNRPRYIELVGDPGCCPMCGRALEKSVDEAKVSAENERKSDIVGSVVGALTPSTPTTTEVP